MKTVTLLIFLINIVSILNAKRIKGPLRKRFQGRDHNENFIVGGENAPVGAFPWQISLQYSLGSHYCGGAVLTPKHIATAAHCVDGYEASDITIVSGTNQYNKPGQIRKGKELHVHCNYDNPSMSNDIAIVILESPLIIDNLTKTVELPTEPLKQGDQLNLTGWGTTELYGDVPDDLQVLTVNYVPYKECFEAMGNDPSVSPLYNICTFLEDGKGACHGDSGSPLVKDGICYGLVNWGMPCAEGYPDMQANIFYYLDWIRTTISETC